MSKVFSRPVWSIWLVFLGGLLGFVAFADAGAQPAACNYDGQTQATAAYDCDSPAVFECDPVPALSAHEKESRLAALPGLFAEFAKFLAAKGVGMETRGLRPLPGTRQIPEGIPDGWRIRPTKGDGGSWYYDPANKGNAVRVMQGDPASPFPNSQSPYVRWQKNGLALDINGNVVPKNTPDAHIPLQDFKFNLDLFK